MINKFLYCLKASFQNIKNNLPLNLITSTTIAITLIIFVSFLMIVLNLSSFKKKWVDQLQVIVYLKDNPSETEIEKTKQYFSTLKEVEQVKYVSKNDALRMLKSSLKGQDGILEGLTENPLPSSFEIKLDKNYLTISGVEQFVKKIENNKVIEDIEYGQKWLVRFMTVFEALKIAGFLLGGFLFIFTVFIISNTIKLMVYSRRDEIEIMKLVGATNLFIKLPFFIEGIIQGLIGAFISLLFLFLSVNILFDKFITSLYFFMGSGKLVFLNFTLAFYVLLLGSLLGFVGSLVSLNSLNELKN